MTSTKARSRLAADSLPEPTPPIVTSTPAQKPVTRLHVSSTLGPLPVLVGRYVRHWPWAIVAGLAYLGVYKLIMTTPPQDIQHILFPNSYLPFQAVTLLANCSAGTFIFLSPRRGVLAALALQTLLFLKLQAVIITPQLVIMILVLFGTIELCANLISFFNYRSRATAPRPPVHTLR